MPTKSFRLCADTSQVYIGNILDVLNRYLDFGAEEYTLGGGGGLLANMSCATMNGDNGREKIIVTRIEKDVYTVDGFPEEGNFDDFVSRAPDLLREILRRNI